MAGVPQHGHAATTMYLRGSKSGGRSVRPFRLMCISLSSSLAQGQLSCQGGGELESVGAAAGRQRRGGRADGEEGEKRTEGATSAQTAGRSLPHLGT